MKIQMQVWSEDLDVTSLAEVPSGIDLPGELLSTEEPASDALCMYLWRLRRELWHELIGSGRLEVTFTHDGEAGSGTGPNLQFKHPDGTGRIIETPSFLESDLMYGDYGGTPAVFGWPEFVLENLTWEDLGDPDDDEALYEFTFSSEDRLAVVDGVKVSGQRWHELEDSEQAEIVRVLQREVERQLTDWDEVMLDAIDVFCAIAAHPGTDPAVVALALAADERCASVLGTSN